MKTCARARHGYRAVTASSVETCTILRSPGSRTRCQICHDPELTVVCTCTVCGMSCMLCERMCNCGPAAC